jgi:hypothetical protein
MAQKTYSIANIGNWVIDCSYGYALKWGDV